MCKPRHQHSEKAIQINRDRKETSRKMGNTVIMYSNSSARQLWSYTTTLYGYRKSVIGRRLLVKRKRREEVNRSWVPMDTSTLSLGTEARSLTESWALPCQPRKFYHCTWLMLRKNSTLSKTGDGFGPKGSLLVPCSRLLSTAISWHNHVSNILASIFCLLKYTNLSLNRYRSNTHKQSNLSSPDSCLNWDILYF